MRRILFLTAFAVCVSPYIAEAQGVLIDTQRVIPLPRIIPPRPRPQPAVGYGVDEVKVEARIRDVVAQVQVTQVFRNSGTETLESQFLFPLPYDSAIDSVTLLVDGKEFAGQLLSADEAKKRYEEIVRRNRDPALLQWIGSGLFQTNVFPIPPGATRTVTLSYSQLLRKADGLIDFQFPLAVAKYSSHPVKQLSVQIQIEQPEEIKTLYSPSHDVQISRDGDRSAKVTLTARDLVPQEDFRLLISGQSGKIGMSLLSCQPEAGEDGYFLLLATPEIANKEAALVAKTVIFAIDKSGSMSGKKFEQTQAAARFLLNQLNDDDLFNIVTFDSTAQAFQPELQGVNESTRKRALTEVDRLFAGGGTNLDQALSIALEQLKDRNRPSYLFLMTDGAPTSGVTNEAKIALNARQHNAAATRLMVFGVGHDVNSRLLDRLARDHRGLSEYVGPNEDIEAAIARVAQRVQRPVLTDIQLTFTRDDSSPVVTNRLYPAGEFDLFAGEQLVVLGRYKHSGEVKIAINGQVNGTSRRYDFDATFAASGKSSRNAFIPRLWATRRIGELIDEIDLNGKNNELIQELVQLSTKHGILTPYTSFLADDSVRPELTSTRNFGAATDRLEILSQSTGQSAFEQRGLKQSFKNATRSPVSGSDLSMIASQPSPGGISMAAPEMPARSKIVTRGDQTLYRRGKMIVTPQTANLDPEKDKSKIQEVTRFSNEYFALAAENTPAENELLSEQGEDETLLVQLRGVNYLIK